MKKLVKILLTSFVLMFLINNHFSAQQLTKFQKWEQPSYFRGFDVGLWCSTSDCEKTQEDINSLKKTGANLAQINVYGVGFRYPEYPYDKNPVGIEWITRMVNFCRNAELYYTIAVRVGPGRYDVSDDLVSPIWGNTDQVKMYGKMLKEIAAAFLPDTLFVGINLTVEPNPFAEPFLSPADLKQTLIDNGVDLFQIYKTWIDSVRKVTADLPLIVQAAQYSEPEYWGDPVFIQKQEDPYIVYDFHTYEPMDDFTHYPTINGTTYPTIAWNETEHADVLWDSTFYADVVFSWVKSFQQSYNVPIFMGEFGMFYPQNNGEKYLKDIYDIAINNNWHFALWTWRADGSAGQIYYNYERFDEVSPGTNYWNTVKSFFNSISTGVNERKANKLPTEFVLYQNYPNPFNPTTTIKYQIAKIKNQASYFVLLKVYNSIGEDVATLVNEQKLPGVYEATFDATSTGSGLSSGVYFYTLSAGNYFEAKRLLLLK